MATLMGYTGDHSMATEIGVAIWDFCKYNIRYSHIHTWREL